MFFESGNDSFQYTTDNYGRFYVNNFTTEMSIDNTTTLIALNRTALPLMHEIISNFNLNSTNLFDNSKNHSDTNQLNAKNNDIKSNILSLRKTCLVVFFSSIILITVFGNTLVILSVSTTRRLRTVTNCFVMSLAIADWMVGVFVMPPAVLLYIDGKELLITNLFLVCTFERENIINL